MGVYDLIVSFVGTPLTELQILLLWVGALVVFVIVIDFILSFFRRLMGPLY